MFSFTLVNAQSCGETLTSSVSLDEDLECTTQNGFIVGTNSITIDCAGYKLTGNGSSGSVGISLNEKSDVIIENCQIDGWNTGIKLLRSHRNLVRDSEISGNNGNGISLIYSRANNFTGNNISSNNGNGLFLNDNSDGNLIDDNTIHYNRKYGILIYDSVNNYGDNNDILIDPNSEASRTIYQTDLNYVNTDFIMCYSDIYSYMRCSSGNCVGAMTDDPFQTDECSDNSDCSGSPPSETHMGCQCYGEDCMCIEYDGPGTDNCTVANQETDCSAPPSETHMGCECYGENCMCIEYEGPGTDNCTVDNQETDCSAPPSETHWACNITGTGGACLEVQGAGEDTCVPDDPLRNWCDGLHNDCNDATGECIFAMIGEERDECYNDGDCPIGPTHLECNITGDCVAVEGEGDDLCSNTDGRDWCDGQHYACNGANGNCELREHEGKDLCSSNSECKYNCCDGPTCDFDGCYVSGDPLSYSDSCSDDCHCHTCYEPPEWCRDPGISSPRTLPSQNHVECVEKPIVTSIYSTASGCDPACSDDFECVTCNRGNGYYWFHDDAWSCGLLACGISLSGGTEPYNLVQDVAATGSICFELTNGATLNCGGRTSGGVLVRDGSDVNNCDSGDARIYIFDDGGSTITDCSGELVLKGASNAVIEGGSFDFSGVCDSSSNNQFKNVDSDIEIESSINNVGCDNTGNIIQDENNHINLYYDVYQETDCCSHNSGEGCTRSGSYDAGSMTRHDGGDNYCTVIEEENYCVSCSHQDAEWNGETCECDDNEVPGSTCNDGIDNDCDGEWDYDGTHDGIIKGDDDCPVEIDDINILDSNPSQGTSVEVDCTSTVADVYSVEAYTTISGTQETCTWTSWNGNDARFTCDVDSNCEITQTITCTVDTDESYQSGTDKSDTIDVRCNDCDFYIDSNECNEDGNCVWCNECNGVKSFVGTLSGSQGCVEGEYCEYICNRNSEDCIAECDSGGGCDDAYEDCIDCICMTRCTDIAGTCYETAPEGKGWTEYDSGTDWCEEEESSDWECYGCKSGYTYSSNDCCYCGDNAVQCDEECDYGTSGSSYCTTSCTWTYCGDGVVQSPSCNYNSGEDKCEEINEECDELSTGATLSTCSDGGETYYADECSSTCQVQDRDSTCRSSSYYADCTADDFANGNPVDWTYNNKGSGSSYYGCPAYSSCMVAHSPACQAYDGDVGSSICSGVGGDWTTEIDGSNEVDSTDCSSGVTCGDGTASNGFCCGDDAGENYIYCEQTGTPSPWSSGCTSSADACCDTSSDCVDTSGYCRATEYVTGDKICSDTSNYWVDCDYNSDACSACSGSNEWNVGSGDCTGEYCTTNCCGDDTGEYYNRYYNARAGTYSNYWACCSSSSYCVASDSQCYKSGVAGEFLSNYYCENKGWYVCNSNYECEERSSYKCSVPSTGTWRWYSTTSMPSEVCNDGIDNDCDGDTDCFDSDCECPTGQVCTGSACEWSCVNNGYDCISELCLPEDRQSGSCPSGEYCCNQEGKLD